MDQKGSEITLLEMRDLALKLRQTPGDQVVHLIAETIWGTPGGMRYRHSSVEGKINDLGNPWYMVLERKEQVAGVLCLDQRVLVERGDELSAFFIRYFSVAEGLRRKTKVDAAAEAKESRGNGLFKRFNKSFFNNPKPLLEAGEVEKALLYAYVEKENARSMEMVMQMGLQSVAEFKTMIFSRVFPKKRATVRKFRPEEREMLLNQIQKTYSEYGFFTGDGLFYKDNYYVLELDGKIVAGMQAQKASWHVVEIPGFLGKVAKNILPYVPFFSRLINPKKHQFAALEGFFWLDGHENKMQELLEGVIADMGLNSAVLWFDVENPKLAIINQHVRWGLLQKLQDDLPVNIMAKQIGAWPDGESFEVKRPVYVSAFDAT